LHGGDYVAAIARRRLRGGDCAGAIARRHGRSQPARTAQHPEQRTARLRNLRVAPAGGEYMR